MRRWHGHPPPSSRSSEPWLLNHGFLHPRAPSPSTPASHTSFPQASGDRKGAFCVYTAFKPGQDSTGTPGVYIGRRHQESGWATSCVVTSQPWVSRCCIPRGMWCSQMAPACVPVCEALLVSPPGAGPRQVEGRL